MNDPIANAHNNGQKTAQDKAPKNRFPILFIAAFLAAVLLFSGILLTVSAVQKSRYAVRFGNTGVKEGALCYLSLYVKQSYLAELHAAGVSSAADSAAFWASSPDGDKTYGELLDRKTRDYVGGLLIAASLYDGAASFGKEGRNAVKKLVDERIGYMAGGSEEEYDEAVKQYGFDRKSATEALTLQYKAKYAPIALYGADGSGMAEETAFLDRLLDGYSHVALFYVYADNAPALSEIRAAIAGNETQIISPIQFSNLKQQYDVSDETVSTPDGFYFREGTSYTKAYASYYPETAEKALSMAVGEYAETSCTLDGKPSVCFLYRAEPTLSAYADPDNEEFFGDFYTLAASLRFDEVIAGFLSDVIFTARYDARKLLALPYDGYYQYYVRF